MVEYKGLLMIAVIYNGNNEVGMRLYDTESGNIVDTSIKSVENNLKNGRAICNLRIGQSGKVEAVSGDSLDCYANLDINTRRIKGKAKFVVAYKNNLLFCIDWNGMCKKSDVVDIVTLMEKGNIANITYAKEAANTVIMAAGNKWYVPVREVPKGFTPVVGGEIKVGTETFDGVRKLKVMKRSSGPGNDNGYGRIHRYPSNNFIILFTGLDKHFVLQDEIDNVDSIRFNCTADVYANMQTNNEHCNIGVDDIVYMDRKLSVTSSEIINYPGILGRKMEQADTNWVQRFGDINDKIGGLLLVARKKDENKFTVVVWRQAFKQINLIELDVTRTLLESVRASISPFKLEPESERVINQIDIRFGLVGRVEAEEPKFSDLIYMERNGKLSSCYRFRLDKKLEDKEMIRDMRLLPILSIDDRAIQGCIKIDGRYLYDCDINDVRYNVVTDISPDNVKSTLDGKIMVSGFDVYVHIGYEHKASYKPSDIALTYHGVSGSIYPTVDRGVMYMYSHEMDKIYNKQAGKVSGEDRGVRYIGYIGWEMVFGDNNIYYKIDPELLRLLREAVIASYVDIAKGVLVVFIGSYRIAYDLAAIKSSIEKAKEVRGKVEQAQNVHSVIGLDNIDGAGYVVLNNKEQVNSYYRNRPLVLTSKGVVGIKAGRDTYCISELVTNQNLAFSIPYRLMINNAKFGHGAEATFCRMIGLDSIVLDCAEYGKGFKLSSSQYSSLINNLVKYTYRKVYDELGLRKNKNESILGKYNILNSIEYNSNLAYGYINYLYIRCNDDTGSYRKLNMIQLFRGKSELVIKGILTEKKLAERMYRDAQERTNEAKTLIEWSYLMAITAAIISGEEDVIYCLDYIVDKMRMMRFRNNNLMAYYSRYKHS